MFKRFHVWAGIAAAIPWILQGLTGALLVFEQPLDAMTNRSLYFVEPGEKRLDIDEAHGQDLSIPPHLLSGGVGQMGHLDQRHLVVASTAVGFFLFFSRRARRRSEGPLYRWHQRLGVWAAPMVFLIAFNGAFVTQILWLITALCVPVLALLGVLSWQKRRGSARTPELE